MSYKVSSATLSLYSLTLTFSDFVMQWSVESDGTVSFCTMLRLLLLSVSACWSLLSVCLSLVAAAVDHCASEFAMLHCVE